VLYCAGTNCTVRCALCAYACAVRYTLYTTPDDPSHTVIRQQAPTAHPTTLWQNARCSRNLLICTYYTPSREHRADGRDAKYSHSNTHTTLKFKYYSVFQHYNYRL
jgi:hypothetical protein